MSPCDPKGASKAIVILFLSIEEIYVMVGLAERASMVTDGDTSPLSLMSASRAKRVFMNRRRISGRNRHGEASAHLRGVA
jgi:hypothetical protein